MASSIPYLLPSLFKPYLKLPFPLHQNITVSPIQVIFLPHTKRYYSGSNIILHRGFAMGGLELKWRFPVLCGGLVERIGLGSRIQGSDLGFYILMLKIFSCFYQRIQDEQLQHVSWYLNIKYGDDCLNWALYQVSWVVQARDKHVGSGLDFYSTYNQVNQPVVYHGSNQKTQDSWVRDITYQSWHSKVHNCYHIYNTFLCPQIQKG